MTPSRSDAPVPGNGRKEHAWELWAGLLTLGAIGASIAGSVGTDLNAGLFEGLERSYGARDLTWSLVAGAFVGWFATEVAAKRRRAHLRSWFVYPLLLVAAYASATGRAFQWLFSAPWQGEGVPGTVKVAAFGWYAVGAVAIVAALIGAVLAVLRSGHGRHQLPA